MLAHPGFGRIGVTGTKCRNDRLVLTKGLECAARLRAGPKAVYPHDMVEIIAQRACEPLIAAGVNDAKVKIMVTAGLIVCGT